MYIGEKESHTRYKSRFTVLKFLIIVLPLWLSAKVYSGPYKDLVSDYFSSILLIILFGLLVQIIFFKADETSLLIALFLICSSIQVVHYFFPLLLADTTVQIGTYSIGVNYSLHMIPYYGVGAFIGYFILKACRAGVENV